MARYCLSLNCIPEIMQYNICSCELWNIQLLPNPNHQLEISSTLRFLYGLVLYLPLARKYGSWATWKTCLDIMQYLVQYLQP